MYFLPHECCWHLSPNSLCLNSDCRAPGFPSGSPSAQANPPSPFRVSLPAGMSGWVPQQPILWRPRLHLRWEAEPETALHTRTCSPAPEGSPVGACANGTWLTNQLIPLGQFEMKTQKVDRSRAGWRDGQPVAESTVVDLRKAGPQTRTCYDTSELPELLTDHQRLGCPLNNVLLLRQRWLPVLFPPS